jgi:hypothetical protein
MILIWSVVIVGGIVTFTIIGLSHG